MDGEAAAKMRNGVKQPVSSDLWSFICCMENRYYLDHLRNRQDEKQYESLLCNQWSTMET